MKRILAALIVLAGMLLPSAHANPPATEYVVGVASRSINPDADGTFGGEPVRLGGYGFGTGPVFSQAFDDRIATGILGPGVTARAVVVATDDDPEHALVIESIETQGSFVAYQQGPYGLEDIRTQAAAATGIPAERIIVAANHTHAGPDTLGVWGGVPTKYLGYIASQSVGAIADAWAARQPATLWLGRADGADLQSNQFSTDPHNQAMDSELRVLQARRPDGHAVATLVNFSAHPTVMGSDNRLVSADWPGPAQLLLEERYGGGAAVVSGTLGRTQPNDGPSYAACNGDQYCAVGHYAQRIVSRADDALSTAVPLGGPAIVDGHSYLITEVAHNVALAAMTVAGGAVGVPISRSYLPPWAVANVFSTVTFSARIGDILISGGPGELYPQIPAAVHDRTSSAAPTQFVIGLAGDQLGYILAPFADAFPEPMRRTVLSGDYLDPSTWQPSAFDNDNYAFTDSHTMGERVICSLLRGAGAVFATGTAWRDARTQCQLFANDMLNPPGADVTASS